MGTDRSFRSCRWVSHPQGFRQLALCKWVVPSLRTQLGLQDLPPCSWQDLRNAQPAESRGNPMNSAVASHVSHHIFHRLQSLVAQSVVNESFAPCTGLQCGSVVIRHRRPCDFSQFLKRYQFSSVVAAREVKMQECKSSSMVKTCIPCLAFLGTLAWYNKPSRYSHAPKPGKASKVAVCSKRQIAHFFDQT